MNIDELARAFPEPLAAAPSVSILRDKVRRRRQRRTLSVSGLTVALVVAVTVVVVATGTEDSVTIAVGPPGRPRQTWAAVTDLVAPASNVHLLSVGSRLVLVSDNERGTDLQRVSVMSIDPDDGGVTDLQFSGGPGEAPTNLAGAVAWGPRVAVLAVGPDGPSLSSWSNARWDGLKIPEAVGDAPYSLGVLGNELVLGDAGDDVLWSSEDGVAWTAMPRSRIFSASSSLISTPAGLVRWMPTGSAQAGAVSADTDVISPADQGWTALPAAPSTGWSIARHAWINDTLYSCGANRGDARYSCTAWASGRGSRELLAPPPMPSSDPAAGFGDGLQMLPLDGRLILGEGASDAAATPPRPPRWLRYEPGAGIWKPLAPPASDGTAAAAVAASGHGFVAFIDPANPIGVHLERLTLDP